MAVDAKPYRRRMRSGRFRSVQPDSIWARPGAILLALALTCLCGLTLLLAVSDPVTADPPVRLYGDAKTQVDSLSAQAKAIQAEIEALDRQLEENVEAYNQLQVQLDDIHVRMTQLRGQLESAQGDYRYHLTKYENRIRDLYKAGGRDAFLELFLEAEGVSDFFSRARVAAQLAEQDRSLLTNLEGSADRLDVVLAEVDFAKGQQLVIREEMRDRQDQITATLADRQAKLTGIDTQIAAIIEAERRRQAEEQERLRQALAMLLNNGQIYAGTLPETDSEILAQFLQTAAAYIGLPYVWGGDRPSKGMDCSGYTQFVYKQHGVKLPHYSGYQAQMGLPVGYADMKAGDLLAFGFPVHHVGIYVGEDLFIHAAGTGTTIQIARLSNRSDLAAIRRFDLKPRNGEPAFY